MMTERFPKLLFSGVESKKVFPLQREGVRGLSFSAVTNLGDEHLNTGGGKGDST